MLYPVHLQIRAMIITALAVPAFPKKFMFDSIIPNFIRTEFISPCVANKDLNIKE